MAESAIKAYKYSEVDQTPGNSVTLGLAGMPIYSYADGARLLVHFPFYCKNTNYTVTTTNIGISDIGTVGPVSDGFVRTKYHNGAQLVYAYANAGWHLIQNGTVTITFA